MIPKPSRASAVATDPEDPGREVTREEIAARAYEIHVSGTGGDEVENWFRAEQELNGDLDEEHVPQAEQDEEQQPDEGPHVQAA